MSTRYFILNSTRGGYHNKPRRFTELSQQEYFAVGGTKKCRTCEREQPIHMHYKLASSSDGLHPECKDCCKVNRSLEAVRKRDKSSKISVRQRVRAMNLGVLVDRDITLDSVFRKARGVCYICKLWVQPRHASMDHKVALARGGKHEHTNVLLTHLRCNLKKGTSHIHAE